MSMNKFAMNTDDKEDIPCPTLAVLVLRFVSVTTKIRVKVTILVD